MDGKSFSKLSIHNNEFWMCTRHIFKVSLNDGKHLPKYVISLYVPGRRWCAHGSVSVSPGLPCLVSPSRRLLCVPWVLPLTRVLFFEHPGLSVYYLMNVNMSSNSEVHQPVILGCSLAPSPPDWSDSSRSPVIIQLRPLRLCAGLWPGAPLLYLALQPCWIVCLWQILHTLSGRHV